MPNVYKGRFTDEKIGTASEAAVVTINGARIKEKSEGDVFAWGYNGSGPAALAWAILAHEFDADFADIHHQNFKRACISRLPEKWTLTSDEVRGFVTAGGKA